MKNKWLLRDFSKYASLNILGMLGLSCYILADTFFISNRLGSDGLAALNLAIPIYSFIHGCGLMLGIGGATKYAVTSRREGSRAANQCFSNTLVLGLLFAAVFVCAGLFFSSSITALLGADSSIFHMTNIYLKVILLFSPAFLLNNIFLSFVRNDSNPRLAMLGMLMGSMANILMDYVFMYPLNMGIFGAVLATGFSPLISLLLLSFHRIHGKNQFHLVKTRPTLRRTANILALGFPSLITEVSSGVVILIFNMLLLGLEGNIGVAAYGIVANLSLVIISIYSGIAQGIQPLISRFYGNQEPKSIKTILRYALITVAILSLLIYILIYVLAAPITDVFNSEKNLRLESIAILGLRLYFTAVLFAGFNIVISMYFTATEKALPAQIISILRGLVIIIPIAYLLTAFWGLTGIWLAFPVTEGIVAILSLILCRAFHKP